MKGVSKWILRIALSIAGVGLVFCIAGRAMGGRLEDVDHILQTRRYVETIDQKIVEISDANDSSDGSYIGETYSQTYDGVEKLEVEVPVMQVVVQESDREDVLVSMMDVPDRLRSVMSVSQQGKELKIEVKESVDLKNWLETQGDYGTLVIELPHDMKLREASFQIGAGELIVDDIYAEELDIEVSAGNVSVAQFTAEKVDVECGTGEAFLGGTVLKEIDIECGIGSVTFNDSGKESDYEYELSCGIGSLQVGDQSYDGLGGTEKIKNTGGSKKMKIECGIGDVEVYFEQNE